MSHLRQIDAGEIWEVKSYLQKVLKSDGSTRSLGSKAKIQQTQLIQQTRINYIISLFQILSHLGQIDAGEISEVKSYLQKVLKSDGSTGSLSSEPEINGTEENKNRVSTSVDLLGFGQTDTFSLGSESETQNEKVQGSNFAGLGLCSRAKHNDFPKNWLIHK